VLQLKLSSFSLGPCNVGVCGRLRIRALLSETALAALSACGLHLTGAALSRPPLCIRCAWRGTDRYLRNDVSPSIQRLFPFIQIFPHRRMTFRRGSRLVVG